MHREVDRVDTEAIDAAVKPEAGNPQHGVLHLGVVHVHLRLAAQEIVQIILAAPCVPRPCWPAEHRLPVIGRRRSEEHTSELQSLMRISYAVFCLKKQTK